MIGRLGALEEAIMILGTVLESKVRHTIFGREYQVQWDSNPAAKSMDGQTGTALSQGSQVPLNQGDRVILEYRVGPGCSYGLWFIVRRLS